jgi:chromosome segregation ATPase
MLKKISDWLKNPDRNFADGVAIWNDYKKTDKNCAAFDKFFSATNPAKNSTQFTMLVRKVADIHRKLSANPSLIKQPPVTVAQLQPKTMQEKFAKRLQELKSERPRIVDNPIVDVKELPENLQQLYFKNKELVKKRAGYHMKAKSFDEGAEFNEQRKKYDDLVVEIDDEIAENWRQIDNWHKEKNNPPAEKEPDAEPKLTDKVKKINNLTNYINRAKAKIKSFPEEAAKLTPKINKWQAELDELTKE